MKNRDARILDAPPGCAPFPQLEICQCPPPSRRRGRLPPSKVLSPAGPRSSALRLRAGQSGARGPAIGPWDGSGRVEEWQRSARRHSMPRDSRRGRVKSQAPGAKCTFGTAGPVHSLQPSRSRAPFGPCTSDGTECEIAMVTRSGRRSANTNLSSRRTNLFAGETWERSALHPLPGETTTVLCYLPRLVSSLLNS